MTVASAVPSAVSGDQCGVWLEVERQMRQVGWSLESTRAVLLFVFPYCIYIYGMKRMYCRFPFVQSQSAAVTDARYRHGEGTVQYRTACTWRAHLA
jgi:hypothetical protein